MQDKPRHESPRARPRRATLKDVAAAADVSPMTVSNVLNGRLQYVSTDTRQRVEREIARLGYRRQSHARNLRSAAALRCPSCPTSSLPKRPTAKTAS